MAGAILGTLLQTHLRTEPLLTNIEEKRGPRIQTYDAVTGDRLPKQRKPKGSKTYEVPMRKVRGDSYDSHSTEHKYTDELTIRVRNKSLDEYERSLPTSLRKKFHDTYIIITEGIPNHQESTGSPLHAHPEKKATRQPQTK